jgi:hypothetical protein
MKGHTLRFVHDAMAGQDRFLHSRVGDRVRSSSRRRPRPPAPSATQCDRSNQRELTQEEIAARERMHGQDTMLQESNMNPFRGQMNQAASLASLDELERGTYTPVQLSTEGNPYASYIPKVSGGYSYTKSPELTSAAGALKHDVLAGHGASSVLRPDIATNRTPAAPAPRHRPSGRRAHRLQRRRRRRSCSIS